MTTWKLIVMGLLIGHSAIAEEVIDYSCHHVQFQQIESKLAVLSQAEAEKYKVNLRPLYELRSNLYEQAKQVETEFKNARDGATSEEIKASAKREQEHWQSEQRKVDLTDQQQVREFQKRQNESIAKLQKDISTQVYQQREFQKADAELTKHQTKMDFEEGKVNSARLNIPDPQRQEKARVEALSYAASHGQSSLPQAALRNDTMLDLMAMSKASERIAGAADRLDKLEFVAADHFTGTGTGPGFDSKVNETVQVANDYRKILRNYDSGAVAMMMTEKHVPNLPPAEIRQSWKDPKQNVTPELQQATSRTIGRYLQVQTKNELIRNTLQKHPPPPPPQLTGTSQQEDSKLQKWQKETTQQIKQVVDEIKTYVWDDNVPNK